MLDFSPEGNHTDTTVYNFFSPNIAQSLLANNKMYNSLSLRLGHKLLLSIQMESWPFEIS